MGDRAQTASGGRDPLTLDPSFEYELCVRVPPARVARPSARQWEAGETPAQQLGQPRSVNTWLRPGESSPRH